MADTRQKRRLPPLNSLRAFEAAARHRSFKRAAEELFVTPAAISQQVKSLEGYLGVELFRRLTRAIELTPAAEAMLPKLREGAAFRTWLLRIGWRRHGLLDPTDVPGAASG